MNYDSFTSAELATDPFFVQWVKQPDSQSQEFWSDWLLQHPEKKKTVEEARHLVLLMQFGWDPATEERVDALWHRISATNRASGEVADPGQDFPGQTKYHWPSWLKVAASVAAIALLSALFFLNRRPAEVGHLVQDQRAVEAEGLVRYQTAAGEIKEIVLPDGSAVVLNANSTLTIQPEWDSERKVWLSGEAFFSVRKVLRTTAGQETMTKFTVHTSSLQVQVVGTEFNVSDRDQKAVVVLNSGSIRLRLPSDTTILMVPGELASFEKGGQKLVKKEVKPETYSAWINSEWILDNLTLEEVAAKIKETYNVEVEIRNKQMGKDGISGVVPTDNLDNLLEALATTLNVEVVRREDKVIME